MSYAYVCTEPTKYQQKCYQNTILKININSYQ